jgi:hypothetical protein
VLTWGGDVTVIELKELREYVVEKAKGSFGNTGENYQ